MDPKQSSISLGMQPQDCSRGWWNPEKQIEGIQCEMYVCCVVSKMKTLKMQFSGEKNAQTRVGTHIGK